MFLPVVSVVKDFCIAKLKVGDATSAVANGKAYPINNLIAATRKG